MTIHALRQSAAYAASQASRPLPQGVLDCAKGAIVDWFASYFAGLTLAPTTQLLRAHRAEFGQGLSSIPGTGLGTSPALAAWINGTASHAAEFDDIFRAGAYHPGSPVIAGGLAAAEATQADGALFLRAVVGGYEVSTRIAAAMQPGHGRHFHATGTVGALGSAVAASMMFRPGCEATAQSALALASTFAAGLQRTFLSDGMGKALHAGHAAMMGVLAAQAAASGVTGPPDMFDGEGGFSQAFDGPAHMDFAADLGVAFNICSLTQKLHGCCGLTFASIDAALMLARRDGIDCQQVARVLVRVPAATLKVAHYEAPVTVNQARFSLKYVVSHALAFGSVGIDAFSVTRLHDDRVRRLMPRVHVEEDAELSAAPLSRQRGSSVVIQMKDGRTHTEQVRFRRGDPEQPLSDAELRDKYQQLSYPVVGVEPADRLLEQLNAIERLGIGDLRLRQLASRQDLGLST